MTYLFRPKNIQALQGLIQKAPLLAFDFDGTLAPLVQNHEGAKLSKKTEMLLKHLAQLYPVIIVSGRSIKDLKSRLRNSKWLLIGNHGVEGLQKNTKHANQSKRLSLHWQKSIEQVLDSTPLLAKIALENKTYSLSLHLRYSKNKAAAKKILVKAAMQLEPIPRLVHGKSVINLIPQGLPHKGDALLSAMKKLKKSHAFFIGDDVTDEDAFSLKNKKIFSVRIGKKMGSSAKYHLKRQSEINRVLKYFLQINQ